MQDAQCFLSPAKTFLATAPVPGYIGRSKNNGTSMPLQGAISVNPFLPVVQNRMMIE